MKMVFHDCNPTIKVGVTFSELEPRGHVEAKLANNSLPALSAQKVIQFRWSSTADLILGQLLEKAQEGVFIGVCVYRPP